MATFDNYSENGLPTEAVIVPGVSPEALKPATVQEEVQVQAQPRQFAIPTVAEKQAWRQQATRDISPVSGMINLAADDLAKTNPAGAENLRKLGVLYNQALQQQEEERAWRLGEMKAAREMMDRMQEASQRRSAKEYDDQSPSWGDVFVDNPIVQNTIGKRRYNPYTGEIEHHYPRNVAEGVGNVVEHLPELAHAFFTGDNALQRHNRQVDEYNMVGPYEKQMAQAEDYRTGRMVQPGATAMDKLAEMYAKAQVQRDNDAAELEDLYRLSNRVGQLAGAPVGSAYFRQRLGLPAEATSSGNIDMLLNDPYITTKDLEATASSLAEKVANASTPQEAQKAAEDYSKVKAALETRYYNEGGTRVTDTLNKNLERRLGYLTRQQLKGAYNGRLVPTLPAEGIDKLREMSSEINNSVASLQRKLNDYIAKGHTKEEAKEYAKWLVENEPAMRTAGIKRNALEQFLTAKFWRGLPFIAAGIPGMVVSGIYEDELPSITPGFWNNYTADQAAQRGYADYLMQNAADPEANMRALQDMVKAAQAQAQAAKQNDPMSQVDTTGTGT
ncbi:hypothetical protein J6U78_03840 [bacterium]|nr:hypothetical protein [bacterium]